MELRDLRVFVTVVESAGFTRAGARLHMVQSAVSDAVARLERELGVQVLERRRAGARPTPAGVLLNRWARLLLNSADRAAREVAAFRSDPAGEVRVGMLPTITPLVLPPLLARLRRAHARLQVRVQEGLAPELLEGLRTADLDLVVLFFPTEPAADLAFVDLASRPLTVLAGADHRLARRRSIRLREVAEDGWVTFPPHNPGRLWLEQACRLAGFSPRIAVEVETPTQQQIFVEAGAGIAMVPFDPGRARRAGGGDVSVLRLAAPVPEFRIGYAHLPRPAAPGVAAAMAALAAILAPG